MTQVSNFLCETTFRDRIKRSYVRYSSRICPAHSARQIHRSSQVYKNVCVGYGVIESTSISGVCRSEKFRFLLMWPNMRTEGASRSSPLPHISPDIFLRLKWSYLANQVSRVGTACTDRSEWCFYRAEQPEVSAIRAHFRVGQCDTRQLAWNFRNVIGAGVFSAEKITHNVLNKFPRF